MATDAPVFAIIGASGGIGAATCRHLHAQGHRLVIGARNADRLQALAGELGAHAIPVDATRAAEVDAFMTQAKEHHGRLDGVALCVGSVMLKPAHLTTDDEWATTLALNLTSAFYVVRAAARVIPGAGSVVLIASVAARVGLVNHEAIGAAKAGVIGLTLSAAATYASRGLRFNCVAPGLVSTPMTERLTANPASLKVSTAMHPLGRIGAPDDIASAITWFLDPKNSWITGQVLGADGGLATLRGRPGT